MSILELRSAGLKQSFGQIAAWFDLAAQRPMIWKMYGMIFATGDSVNRMRPDRPDEFARPD